MTCSECLVIIASILTAVALTSLLVAFCTDNWHHIVVDNDVFYQNTIIERRTSGNTTAMGDEDDDDDEDGNDDDDHESPPLPRKDKVDKEEERKTDMEDDDDYDFFAMANKPRTTTVIVTAFLIQTTQKTERSGHNFARLKRDLPEIYLEKDPNNNKSVPYEQSRFYSRTMGLFRLCFIENKPPGVEGDCIDISYSSIEKYNTSAEFARVGFRKMHCRRGVVALLSIALLLMFLTLVGVCITGFYGRIPPTIAAVGICLLIGFVMVGLGVAIYVLMDRYEHMQWEKIVAQKSRVSFDWSFWLAVCSGFITFIAAILYFVAACCLRAELPTEEIFTSELYYFD